MEDSTSIDFDNVSGAKDYYSILNVSSIASSSEIANAYHKLKNIYSKNNEALYSLVDGDDCLSPLEEIIEAYEVIGNVKKRAEYDKLITKAGGDNSLVVNVDKVDGEAQNEIATKNPTVNYKISRENNSSRNNFHRPILAGGAKNQVTKKIMLEMLGKKSDLGGALFVELRSLLDISREELRSHIKISHDNIKNLEEENFSCLPSRVYVKGFLRNYLRFLGLSQDSDIVDIYLKRFDEWKKKY